MPSQRALLALLEQAKAQLHKPKRGRASKRGTAGRGLPATGRPASAPPARPPASSSVVPGGLLAFGVGSTLESRVAMQESKRAAVQSALSSLAPLQYKSQRPISGAVRRELEQPASPPLEGPLCTASAPDTTPVDLNGMPRILGMPPGIQGRPATAPRTGSVVLMHKTEAVAPSAIIPTTAVASGSGIKIHTIFNKSRRTRNPELEEEKKRTHLWDSHIAHLAARDPDTGSRTAASRALTAAQLAGERHGVGASAGTMPGAAAADRAGEVGRLAGRYQRGSDRTVWDLSHTVRGASQVRGRCPPQFRAVCD